MKGTMHWFSPRKGYGCIQCQDGNEVFVHQSAIPVGVSLDEGDLVEFKQEESDRGSHAVDIQKL